jgi:DNA polymerase-3 subunit gamma/tau
LDEVPLELSLTPEIDARLSEQAARVSTSEVVRMLDLIGAALESVRAGAEPRTQLELALVKAATPRVDGSTPALIARIGRLEQSLAGGVRPAAADHDHVPAAPAPVAAVEDPPVVRELGPVEPQPAGPTAVGATAVEPQPAEPTPAAPAVAVPVGAESTAVEPTAAGPQPVEPTAAGPQPVEPTATVASVDEDLQTLWLAVLDSIRAEHKLLRAFFNEAEATSVTEDELAVSFSPSASFNKRKAEEPDNRKILLDTLHRLTGRRYRVFFELSDVEITGADAIDGSGLSEDELLQRLMSELDAEELPAGQLAQQKGGD